MPRDYTICDCGHEADQHSTLGCRTCWPCRLTASDLLHAAVAAARVEAARTIASAIKDECEALAKAASDMAGEYAEINVGHAGELFERERSTYRNAAKIATRIADDHANRWAGEQ